MKKKTLYISIIILIFSIELNAQGWSKLKYEFYYGAGLLNFMGDIGAAKDQRIWVEFWETVSPVANAGLRYNYNDRNYLTGTVFMGQMYGQDHENGYPTRNQSFNSFFTEIAVKYEYMIWQEKRKRAVYRKLGESQWKNINIPTYLFAGLGGTLNVGKDAYKESYINIAPTVQLGVGFKYKVGKLNYLNLEASYRVALNDKLDNASGKEYPGVYGEWVDEYQTITINYVHKLRAKRNGMPKFKKR